MDDLTAVSAGENHTLAITTDGNLWAWGANWVGQLGDSTNEDRLVFRPIKIRDDVIAVSAGHDRTLAITTDGSLWLWGSDWILYPGDGPTVVTFRQPWIETLPMRWDIMIRYVPFLLIGFAVILSIVIRFSHKRRHPHV